MAFLWNAVVYLFAVWFLIYGFSYSRYVWKKENRLGACAGFGLFCLAFLLLLWKVAIYR